MELTGANRPPPPCILSVDHMTFTLLSHNQGNNATGIQNKYSTGNYNTIIKQQIFKFVNGTKLNSYSENVSRMTIIDLYGNISLTGYCYINISGIHVVWVETLEKHGGGGTGTSY